DPGEKHNLCADPAYQERIANMRVKLYEDMRAHGDYLARGDWLKGQFLEGRKGVERPINR
ncbi:MAG: hypothetical protein RR482_00370, partial [Clostridia bacterium]